MFKLKRVAFGTAGRYLGALFGSAIGDFALKVFAKIRLWFLVALATAAQSSVAFAVNDPGVVPEPTSALIWLGLIGVISAASGRLSRQR
jgi:hypothetical protein